MNAAIIFVLLIVLMLTGMPISISLGLTVLTFLFTMTDVPVQSVALKLFTGIEKFEIMAIPFFILAGNFLTHGGVARRMIRFATSMIGHWHGGLGLAGVMACALFAAVSGSSPATVVAIGSVILPAMVKQGFPNKFGAGIIATSGSLGILIPPSIAMVMFSVSTNVSVGAMFIAGIVPGIALAVLLGFTTWNIARKNNYPRMPKASWGERFTAFKESVWGLLLIVVVMGGIYSGIFTPTEAAAMAAVYAFIVAVFVYKDMPLKRIPKVLLDSASMSAMLLYIITNAVLFSFLMTSENIPQAMADWMINQGFGPVAFLLVVNILLLLAGNVMEPSSIILILAPILFPRRHQAGHQPDPLRHPDRGQHGGRHVPPAGGAEPVCGLRHYQDGHQRADHGGDALAAHHAGVPGRGHLCARTHPVAAASVGHDALSGYRAQAKNSRHLPAVFLCLPEGGLSAARPGPAASDLQVALDLGLQLGHGLAAGHQVGHLGARLFTLAEIGRLGAAYQHRKVVTHGERVHHVVGDEDHRHAFFARLQDDAQHVRGFLHAQGGGGLVQNQHAGAEVHGARNRQRLALATREAAHQAVAIGDAGDAELAHLAHRNFIRGLAVKDLERAPFFGRLGTDKKRAAYAHQREGAAELVHRGNAAVAGIARGLEVHRLALDQDLARGRFVHAREQANQGGLAGAVVAQQAQDFAGLHFQVDVMQNVNRAEGLVDAAELEQRGGHLLVLPLERGLECDSAMVRKVLFRSTAASSSTPMIRLAQLASKPV
jgi:C4-dicarboxylate transporter, DctM subunit